MGRMGSIAGPDNGGTIIRAAWRQPGVGKLSESVSNTPGLVSGSLRPPGTDYQSGSWILLNGLSCSQPVRYRTPNRRAPNLPSRRLELFNTLAFALPHLVGLRRSFAGSRGKATASTT